MMSKGVFFFALGLVAYIQSAPRTQETVWLKDVTTRFQTGKRTLSDHDLPNELIFHLSRGSETLTLNLQRNHDINPDADVYFVRKLKDGQSVLVKTRYLEKEDVVYYQDRENGAFMTVRCVKKSYDQCDRLINGNIRIGHSSYDLRPAETDVTSRNVLDAAGPLGKRYVLQDQTHIQGENSVENKDKSRQLPNVYYIEVAVLIDSGIWDIYSSMVHGSMPLTVNRRVKRNIRAYFSHIINGINLRYKTFADASISVSVVPTKFIIFKRESHFPHRESKVTLVNGRKYIDVFDYLNDISRWDNVTGSRDRPNYDHGMLFTGHKLYRDSYNYDAVVGLSYRGMVCELGQRMSVVESGDYAHLVRTAAHELGHSLGANHDGEDDAVDCNPDDNFLMAPRRKQANASMTSPRNPWIFSPCSIRAFKNILKDKQCVTNPGHIYNNQEYADNMKKLPGEVYSTNEQCQLIYGPSSSKCETPLHNVCHLLRCIDPKTGICLPKYLGAARGTPCGQNMKSRGPI